MFGLLNRLAWWISIVLWFCLILWLTGSLWYWFIGLVTGILVWGIIKALLFSESYIQSQLSTLSEKSIQEKREIPQEHTIKNTLQQEIQKEEEEDVIDLSEISTQPEIQEKKENIYMSHRDTSIAPEIHSEPNIIEKFFAENVIAKIGGIILFLWVLVFLVGIYSVIGPVAKIMIGFLIGFAIYFTWVFLDKKWFTSESRIVMWVALLVNYLVILGWRHLLGDDSSLDTSLLSVGITFGLLILNTIFAVVTSLLYNSRSLLIFWFAFAYLNPLLLGESSSEPYTLLGYTMIVTLGAMYMAYTKKDEVLFPLAFVLASIMFLIAPWSDGTGWVTKLLCINTLGAIALYSSTAFTKSYKYLYEILIAGTFFLIGIMGLLSVESLSQIQFIIMWISSLTLMWLCYMSMNKWAYLYSIGTLWTILTLSPAILINGIELPAVAISIISIFSIMNLWVVLIKSKDLLAHNLWNIISGLISGAIFLTYMIYFFGNEYFSWIAQWFAFFGLAVVYCILSFIVVQKIGIESMRNNEKYENTFYTIAAIGVSLFSLAIAFVFSGSQEIVSIVWLLEANVLFFLTMKVRSIKIGIAWIVLFVIGVAKLLEFLEVSVFWDASIIWNFPILVSFFIILASLVLNLILLFKENTKDNVLSIELFSIHNFFHIIAMSSLACGAFLVFDVSDSWISLLYFSVVVSALGILYTKVYSPWLRMAHLWAYLLLLVAHLGLFTYELGSDSLSLGISTLIIAIYTLPFVYDYVSKWTITNKMLIVAFLGYLFILSTLYVLHLFEVTFAVTLYWGVLAFLLLSYGINKDILYMRTLWLYLLTGTVWKIFLYDIWQPGVDDGVWFIAFMLTGGLMIALSTMYTRKYWNHLQSEFDPSNLFPKNPAENKETPPEETEKIKEIEDRATEKSTIQNTIESMDTQWIKSVKLRFTGETTSVQIRAENLVKISKLIVNTYKKTEFKPWELSEAYTMIEKDYKSSLSPAQYNKIKEIIEKFVKKWGTIEFVK